VTETPECERLVIIAALLEADPDASHAANAWVKADGSPADESLIYAATSEDWDLAAAVRGHAMNDVDVNAIIALLRMAASSPRADALWMGLRELFFDDDPADHASAFAGVYRHVALPGLDHVVRDRASVLLGHLATQPGLYEL
jgi:hypothetical protein